LTFFLCRPGSKETTVIIKERKGFVKLAMRQGADLVPVVVFGEKEVFNKLEINEGLKKWFLKTLKIPLIVFWGQFFTWTPLRKPMGMVFGTPIPVQKNSQPTDEEVDKLHQLFLEEIKKLFYEYRTKFPEIPGAKDQELILH
jgi:1-acyl-sn-glycerol-3-phosphate acyltransferase